jgi:glycosyltransferase involved in cell wall biosynthesis
MRIAQVAPLYESVPPRMYGGTERVVAYLTEELVKQGHEVTLFASGDSVTSAHLVAPCPRALRLDTACRDPLAPHITMLQLIQQQSHQFDIIHFHMDYLHFPIFRKIKPRILTTLHGRLDIPELVPLYKQFGDMPVTSISLAQRAPLSWVHWIGNVYHGLPPDQFTFRDEAGVYLAFLGRICPEKRVDRAIAIAKEAGIPLRIAAKVDRADRAYFEEAIRPLLKDPLVEYIGEINEREKDEFLGRAKALLFPIDWPEPFGLVMIEALACGTPVIAYPHGSVSEVVEPGVTGFIVQDLKEAGRAVENIHMLNRATCRQAFENRFTAEIMAKEYLSLYSMQGSFGPKLEAA